MTFRNLFSLLILCFSLVDMVVWLWVIDFCFWFKSSPTLYVPFVAWGTVVDKGSAINLAYWNICVCFVIAVAAAYGLGRTSEP